MRNKDIMDKILRFVKEFRVVEERQIRTFFADLGHYEVDHAIKMLKAQHMLHEIKETTRVSTDPRLSNLRNYDSVVDALEVMVQLRSGNVSWYTVRDIPFELEFCTDDNINVFTVSVFNAADWVFRYDQTKRLRPLNLPIGEEDPRKHIAVVSDESLGQKIEPLGFYMYAKITDRKTGQIKTWNYEALQ